MSDDNSAWFQPKRFGYGAGWPIAWQGWALLGGYLVLTLVCSMVAESVGGMGGAAAIGLLIIATVALIIIAARKTRGGWRWRWGSLD